MRRSTLVAVLTVLSVSCASRVATVPPSPATPRYPEFRYPNVPQGADNAQATRIEHGWRLLQSDNQGGAEREFAAALKAQPTFHPASTGLGYLELARRDARDAVTFFDRALQTDAGYVPALVGRGQALLEIGRDGDALASFEAAVKVDPALNELQSRIDVLRFRAVQDNLARAKAATDAGRFTEARAAYGQAIAVSPDSAFLYRDLAMVERRAGEWPAALENFRKASSLDPSDALSLAQTGAILEQQGDVPGALEAYTRARTLDAEAVPVEHLTRLIEADALARMPPEYRAIPESATATRGELAALIAVRLAPLVAAARPRQVVMTDARAHWAQPWIGEVVRAGIMETQPNYRFAPDVALRRGELATVVSRVLNLIATTRPERAKAWQGSKQKIPDVPPGHLNYAAVAAAIASGVLPLAESGSFHLLRSVSGAELTEVVARLEALAR